MEQSIGTKSQPALTADAEGNIHSIETAGTVDGPGLRFVVFTSGCLLRCLYCHNPDTQQIDGGKKVMASELVKEIARYRDFLGRNSGGVTVSGGEPLYQAAFVTEIFRGARALGLHTALDTSGFLGAKATDELLALTDLVLLDIKHFDPDGYHRLTGATLQPTLDFARRLSDMGKKMWIRFVLVPGHTDDLAMVEKLADFVSTLQSVERVEILPFHKMGEPKWEALNRPYMLKDTQPPSPELIAAVQGIFRKRGLYTV